MPPAKSGVAVIRTDALRNFKSLVTSLGGDPNTILRKFQVDPALLDNHNAVIPFRVMAQVLECAAAELKRPDFGMRLANIQEGTKVLGPLDIVMRNSRTVGDAYRYCADHVHAYSNATQITLEKFEDTGRVFMHFEILVDRLPHQRQAVEHALLLVQHATVIMGGGQARIREVWCTHEPLAPLATYRAHFHAPVKFGQPMNGLFFDERDLNVPLPNPDPQLYEMATSFIDHRFPASDKTLTMRVRNVIARILNEGDCVQERVAGALGIHPRTLQRRLKEEGESFESIKDAVRRDAALRYLRQRNLPLVQVAAALGYSETSVLSRSCYRWFSVSPRKLRNELNPT